MKILKRVCVCICKKSNWRKLFPFPAYWKKWKQAETKQSPQNSEIPCQVFAWTISFKNRSAQLVCLYVEPQQGDNML